MHAKLSLFVQDLNGLYRERSELNELDFTNEGFQWVDFGDEASSVITFLRRSKGGKQLLVAFNMTPVPRFDYMVGAPGEGFYREILNSDASEYGGSGLGNLGGVHSTRVPWNNRPYSIVLTLPPLAVVVLALEG